MPRSRSIALLSALLTCICFVMSAAAATVTLTSGEILAGKIIEQNDQHVVLEHPILGTLTIPADKITAVTADEAAEEKEKPVTPEQQAVDKALAPEPKPAPARFHFFEGWQAQLEIGGTATRGNSKTLDFRAAFNAKKETKLDRWKFDTAYYYSSSDNETTKNQFTAGIVKDWLIPDSKWFYYAQGRYDHDQFQAWTHRVTAAAGLGYQWIKTDTFSLLTRAGLGGAKEFGGSNELRPEAQLGGELSWKINNTQALNATTYYYPDLSELEQYRLRSTLDWTLKLSQFDGLALKFGLENEYQSYTEDDSFHNDLKVFGSLVIDF